MSAPKRPKLPAKEARALQRHIRAGLKHLGVTQKHVVECYASTLPSETARGARRITQASYQRLRTHLKSIDHYFTFETAEWLLQIVQRFIGKQIAQAQKEIRKCQGNLDGAEVLGAAEISLLDTLAERRERITFYLGFSREWFAQASACAPSLAKWRTERVPHAMLSATAIEKIADLLSKTICTDGAITRGKTRIIKECIARTLRESALEMGQNFVTKWGQNLNDQYGETLGLPSLVLNQALHDAWDENPG